MSRVKNSEVEIAIHSNQCITSLQKCKPLLKGCCIHSVLVVSVALLGVLLRRAFFSNYQTKLTIKNFMIRCYLTYNVFNKRKSSLINFDTVDQFNRELPKLLKNKTNAVCFILMKGTLRFFKDFLDNYQEDQKESHALYYYISKNKIYSENIFFDWIKPIEKIQWVERLENGLFRIANETSVITIPELMFKSREK